MKRFFTLLLVTCFGLFARPDSYVTIGTTHSIIDDLVRHQLRASSTYQFWSTSSQRIPVLIRDFYFVDSVISLTGTVAGSDSSRVMLKGDRREIYGWVILHDRNSAYEYTTDSTGVVGVEQVPVSKVFSMDDFEPPQGIECPGYRDPGADFLSHSRVPQAPHLGPYPGTNVNKLQSYPGAKKVMYMDISDMMKGDNPKTQSKDDVWYTWAIVAGAYSAFKMNVTTDQEVYKAAGVTNGGILHYLDYEGRSSSPVNAFGTSQYATVYRIRGAGHPPGPYCAGRTGWHESGHIMGTLDYGGTPGGTYFEGFPEFKWVPIMGNFWFSDGWGDDQLQQWSKGEYATANCKSDMLAIVARVAPYREDDIPQTKPLVVSATGAVSPDTNYGQICPNTDSDGFTFSVGEKGHAKLKVLRTEWIKIAGTPPALGGTMLDIDASIVDASGKTVAQSNPKMVRHAEFDLDLAQGSYTLTVKGGAEGTPQKGFSTYGSLGFYAIQGEIVGGSTAATAVEHVRNLLKLCSMTVGGMVNLSIPQSCPVERISVYSANGVRVFDSRERVQTIDLRGQAAGAYLLAVTVGGSVVTNKIVRN